MTAQKAQGTTTKTQARKRTVESRRSRREDTRRKILVGAVVLAKGDQGQFELERLMAWLDQSFTRRDDRALLDLQPIESAAQQSKASE
jgi:hypothetical protein